MSVVYNGEHSIDFFNLSEPEPLCMNSWEAFHLIPVSRPYVANPEVQLQSINVPFTNRRIDLTSTLAEGRLYNMRQGQWEFIIDHDKWADWASCYRALVQYFHGFKMAARLSDHDLERIYKGRIVVQGYAPGNDYSRITLQYYFESGKVMDPNNLGVYFMVSWIDWSGHTLYSSTYAWGSTPSYDSAPSGIEFQPSTSTVKSNQVYKESNADEEPTRISIVQNPTKMEYVDGETIDYSGIKVVAKTKTGKAWTGDGSYPNGVIPFNELIFSTYTAHQPQSGTTQSIIVGWQVPETQITLETHLSITVSYGDPVAISVLVLPTKIEYLNGEDLDYTGIVVVAYRANGSVWAPNSRYTDGIIPFEELILSATRVVAEDTDTEKAIPVLWHRPSDLRVLSTSFTISIYPLADHINVTTLPTTLSYMDGDTIDYSGIVVTAYKSNNEAWAPNSNYLSGILPFNELILSVTSAAFGESETQTIPVGWLRPYSKGSLSTSFVIESITAPALNLIERTYVDYVNDEVTFISDYAFYNYTSLKTASFRNVSYIGHSAFAGTSLKSLYLLYSGIVSMSSTSDLKSSPLRIYVPSSLYNSYKIANVWSAYSSKFVSFIE